MKNLIKLCLVTMILISFSCNQDSLNIPESSLGDDITVSKAVNSKMTVPVGSPLVVVQGTSTLHQNKNNITVNFKTNGLIPGHAVTLWWVIWNSPENCATPFECSGVDFAPANIANVNVEVLYAAGHVVGFSGQGTFSASLKKDDDSGSVNVLMEFPPVGGLLDTQKAEDHLVIRTHGPKIPGEVNEQISSYVGGCEENPFLYPPFSFYPDAIGECADIIAAAHPAIDQSI